MTNVTHLNRGEIALKLNDRGELLPIDGESAERYLKLKRNEPYIVTFKRSRNYKFLKKYFSLVKLAFDNQELFDNFEWFRKWSLIAIGWCKEYVDPMSGHVHYEAKSVSFEKCKEQDFEKVYSGTITLFMERFGYDESFFNELRRYD